MDYLVSLCLGFFVTGLTTLLPGLINMSIAKTSIDKGIRQARQKAVGAASVVFIQAFMATAFARFLSKRADISYLIQEVGIIVFIIIGIYFLFFAQKQKIKPVRWLPHSQNYFVLGALLSMVNMFPIPFYIVMSMSLKAYGLFFFDKYFLVVFALGAALGAFSVFMGYASFASQIGLKLKKNINYIIAAITLFVALLGTFRLIQD